MVKRLQLAQVLFRVLGVVGYHSCCRRLPGDPQMLSALCGSNILLYCWVFVVTCFLFFPAVGIYTDEAKRCSRRLWRARSSAPRRVPGERNKRISLSSQSRLSMPRSIFFP